MNSLEQRLAALEQLSETVAVPPAAVAQIVRLSGRTSEQVAQAAAALATGTRIITITEYDGRKTPA